MKKSVFTPCIKCSGRGGCCGCKEHKEWTKWRESMIKSNKWNDFVLGELQKETKKLEKQYKSLLNK